MPILNRSKIRPDVLKLVDDAFKELTKGAIEFLKKKDPVRRGEVVLRIHAASEKALSAATSVLSKKPPVTIEGMLVGRV